MRKFLTIALLLLSILTVQATPKKLGAVVSYSTFYNPNNGPYIETYVSILGKSVNYKKIANGKFQASVEITTIFRINDSIKAFDKIKLLSPEIDDTNSVDFAFHNISRTSLKNGYYDMEIRLKDENSKNSAYFINETVNIEYSSDAVSVSGIELINSYTKSIENNKFSKSGFDIVPQAINLFTEDKNNLTFYTEIYNTDKVFGKDQKYLLRIFIEEVQTSKKIATLMHQQKMTSQEVTPIIHEFDISKLQNGSYNLVIEVKDQSNFLKASNKIYFERENNQEIVYELANEAMINNSFVGNMTNRDTLLEYIKSLRPISTSSEKYFYDNNRKNGDLKTLQRFFLSFWTERDELHPESAWATYANEVKKVNYNYSTKIKKGYETDRGRVYLKYGPPNSISKEEHEPNAYPYEIWHYYSLQNQSNRKFVFYNPDLVTNDYEMLHSDVTGEYSDYNWKVRLQKRNFTTNDLDEQDPNFGWGSKVDDYFNMPR